MRLVCGTSLTFLGCILQKALPQARYQVPLVSQNAQDGTGHKPLLDDEFAVWIEETGRGWGMKGVAIAVTRKNKGGEGWTTETKGYGVADRWGNPVNEESLFPIASNSKLFTALAVGMLTANESVSLEWNSKIKTILPSSVWALQDKVAEEQANIMDILSHRIGLPRHDLSYSDRDTVESCVARLRFLRPSAEFRETFQYNNQMYILASHIVSQLSATSFTEYVTRNIISPLGLLSTTYNVSQAEESGKLVDGFVNAGRSEEKGEGRHKLRFRPIRHWNWQRRREIIAGAGGVLSSVKDIATWLQTLLLLGRSPVTNEVIIPSSVVERVAQGVTVQELGALFPEISARVYGMGQERYTYQGHELIEHGGTMPGYKSALTRSPCDNLGISVLTNWEHGVYFLQVVKFKLLEKAFRLKEVDWNERIHKMAEEYEAAAAPKKTPFSSDAQATALPYYDLAGVYFNPAYGALSLCAYPSPKPPHSSRKECDDLISEARSSLRPLLNESVPTLLAASQRTGHPYLLLRHSARDQFHLSTVIVYPAPFPTASGSDDDSHPFAIEARAGQARFVYATGPDHDNEKVNGIACTGIWGAGKGVHSPKGEGRDGAEVWFDRVA